MAARRRIRWLRWTFTSGLLAVVLAVVAVLGWIASDDFQQRATRAIEAIVERETGEQATLHAVRIQWWPPAVSAEGVHLWNAEHNSTIASIERIAAPVVWSDGAPALGRLAASGVAVHLHVDPDGLREFRNRPPSTAPMQRLPWESLSIADATFRVESPDGELAITQLAVSPLGGAAHDITGKISVRWKTFEQSSPIAWRNVTLGPEVVHVPALALVTPALTLRGSATLPLNGELNARLQGDFHLGALDPLVAPAALRGDGTFDVAVAGTAEQPKLEAALLATNLAYDTVTTSGAPHRLGLGDLHAAVRADRAGLDIEQAVLAWGEGRINVWGTVLPDGALRGAHVLAEDLSLAHVFRQLGAFPTPWVDLLADAEVSVEGTLSPLSLAGDMEVSAAGFRVTDRPIDDPRAEVMLDLPRATVRGRITVDPDAVILFGDAISTPRSDGKAVVRIPVGRPPLDIHADFATLDLADLAPLGGAGLRGRGPVTAHISDATGPMHATGTADVRGFELTGLPYADRLVADIEAPGLQKLLFRNATGWKGKTIYRGQADLEFSPAMRLALDLRFHDRGRIEDIVGVFLDLPGMTGGVTGTLLLNGPLDALNGAGHLRFTEVDLWGERFEGGEADGYMDLGRFTLDGLRLHRNSRREGLLARGSVGAGWAMNLEIAADGLALENFDHLESLRQPLSGKVALLAQVGNTLFEPEPRGRVAVTDVRYFGQPVDDSIVRFATANGVLSYHGALVGTAVAVDGTLGLWGEQPYALHATLSDFPAHLPYPVAADGRSVEATVSGRLDLRGEFGDTPTPVAIEADASDVVLRWGTQQLRNDGRWRYEQNGRTFALHEFGLKGGATHFELSASSSPEQPLRVDGEGHIDLEWLNMVVPGMQRAEGLAEVDVIARGRAPNVEAQVEVRIDGAPLLRHSGFPGSFEDVRATIRADRTGYDLVDVEASVGGGLVFGSGRIEAADWVPTAFRLEAEAQNTQVQWVEWLPPVIGDARLKFDGPTDALLLSGRVDVEEMTFSDRIDWEDWVVEWGDELLVSSASGDAAPWFNMDLAVHANDTIRLRNNVAEGRASADLRFVGDTNRPGIVGRVRLDAAQAFLQDREFNIDRGELTFRDPWTWDPDLDFDLVTDITSRDRRYRVSYLVRGPFSNWYTEARSDPPLPQADLNALLWFGVTADDLENLGALPSAIGQGVADLLLADLLVTNQTAQDIRGELPTLLDRVDLATGVNARGEYSADPRLIIGKSIGATEVTGEIGLVGNYQYWQWDVPITEGWSLALWYSTQQRARNLPIRGAYGFDLKAQWEAD